MLGLDGGWLLPRWEQPGEPAVPAVSSACRPVFLQRSLVPAGGRFAPWTWTEIPPEAELVLRVRNAWLVEPPATAAANQPAPSAPGSLEIAVLDVLAAPGQPPPRAPAVAPGAR